MADQGRRPITPNEVRPLLELGRQLTNARKAAGLTQRQLAERARLSLRHVKRLEHGTRRTRWSTLQRLAPVLNTDPSALREAAGHALAPESPYSGNRQNVTHNTQNP